MHTRDFRNSSFSDNYKVMITDGPLAGLFSRSIVIVSPEGKVAYTEQVPEIVDEPNYDKAIAAIG
jgi:thiol peroxidase